MFLVPKIEKPLDQMSLEELIAREVSLKYKTDMESVLIQVHNLLKEVDKLSIRIAQQASEIRVMKASRNWS